MSTDTQVDIGSEFLGYQIEELIGRGGMGVVYRAYDLRLKRTVALKLVSPELALDQRFRERFSRETEVAMSLEHPNVVPVHDAGDVRGRLYLAMRLVGGTDLRRLLAKEGPLEPSRAVAICGQVANALDAAHAKGLVHRDVKPSNVLLDESEHVYLADFGLTRGFDEQGSQPGDGRSIGTPAYLAPEQIEAKPIDGRADAYALGCLLFECLTGEAPFVRGSRLAVAWAHMEEEPPRASEHRPGLPQAVDPVIAKAMAKEPQERYATCGALVQAATKALGLSRPSRLARRGPALLLAAVVVVLAATLAAVLATRGDKARVNSPLFARPDTLARIDPATSAVSDVIPVGTDPVATVVGGHRVWVYNRGDESITEVDPKSRRVVRTTSLSTFATADDVFSGPYLIADTGGAWLVGDHGATGELTRVQSGGRTRPYPLAVDPRGVAVGLGAVWIVGRGARGSELLRIDPSTGHVILRKTFRSPIDSIAVGDGAVYVVGAASATIYRIDPRSGKTIRKAHFPGRAARPLVTQYVVTLDTSANGKGASLVLDPTSLQVTDKNAFCCDLPSQWGRWENGWWWWFDWSTGSVYRQHGNLYAPNAIRVTKSLPGTNGPCLTSFDLGEGAVWVTTAHPPCV